MDKETKRQFWNALNELVHEIPFTDKIIGRDLNGYVGKDKNGFERIHRGQGFGNRNDIGETILDFALANDFGLVNTF